MHRLDILQLPLSARWPTSYANRHNTPLGRDMSTTLQKLTNYPTSMAGGETLDFLAKAVEKHFKGRGIRIEASSDLPGDGQRQENIH
jgi:hypothetical protein